MLDFHNQIEILQNWTAAEFTFHQYTHLNFLKTFTVHNSSTRFLNRIVATSHRCHQSHFSTFFFENKNIFFFLKTKVVQGFLQPTSQWKFRWIVSNLMLNQRFNFFINNFSSASLTEHQDISGNYQSKSFKVFIFSSPCPNPVSRSKI